MHYKQNGYRGVFAWLIMSIVPLVLLGCAGNTTKPFEMKNLAKSEIDMVIDHHIETLDALALSLMHRLYKSNPSELKKAPKGTDLKFRERQLFNTPRIVKFNEMGDAYANTAIHTAFNPDFKGDRVFALMVGIVGMIHTSYNHQQEFYMLDSIDQQKLYHCARNLESVSWQLNNKRKADGKLFLVSNSMNPDTQLYNLSFERTFGKMIALQDMMAQLLSDRQNRAINKVVHGVASTTLLPL